MHKFKNWGNKVPQAWAIMPPPATDVIHMPHTFVPTHQQENAWVHKFKNWGNKVPQAWANVPLLLDYRCHVPNGTLGIDGLPDQVRGQGTREG